MDTKALRQKILDLAIHGRLVPQDPADEPASVLLQRIREEKERLIKEGKIKKGKKSAKTSDTAHDKNVPFEVPSGWVWCNIKDVTSKITDGTHNSPINTPKGDYKYVTAKNIKPAGVILDNITYVSKDIHDEIYSRCNPQKGDILYIKDGATTGVATINNLEEPFSLLSSVALIKPFKEVSNKFLLYYLQSSLCYSSVRETMKGVGITRVTLKQIEKWNIPLPPLSEQFRIVAEIERWFSLIDIIESNKASLQTAVKQAKAKILDLAIHGKLVPQDPADEPASELLRRINPKAEITSDNAQYGKVPYGWCKCKFEDVFSDISSKPYQILQSQISTKGQIPVVSQSSNFIEGYSEQNNFYKAESPIVIFGDHTRNVKYINFNFIVGADGVKIIIPLHNPKYGYYLIKYASLHIQDKGYSRHFGQIKKFSYSLPPLSEQHRIVSKIEELFAQLDRIEAEL